MVGEKHRNRFIARNPITPPLGEKVPGSPSSKGDGPGRNVGSPISSEAGRGGYDILQ